MLVILDRDGVINHDSPYYIKNPQEWQPIVGSLQAIVALKKAGHLVTVATNQSGVGRGLFTLKTLNAIHAKMNESLRQLNVSLDGIYYCPHLPDENCECRKPKPGMLLQIKQDFPEEFANSILVGDSLRDIEAAHAAGCRAALVRTGKGLQTEADQRLSKNVVVCDDLQSFVNKLILQ